MAQNGRPGAGHGEAGLAPLLATGVSVRSASRQTGVSERTIFRRLADPAFRREVAEHRHRILSETVGRLLSISARAVAALSAGLKSEDDAVRTRSATVVLQQLTRGVEALDLAAEVAELRAAVASLKDGQNGV